MTKRTEKAGAGRIKTVRKTKTVRKARATVLPILISTIRTKKNRQKAW